LSPRRNDNAAIFVCQHAQHLLFHIGAGSRFSKLLDLELQFVDVVAQIFENVAASSHGDTSIYPLYEFRGDFAAILEMLIAEIVACLVNHSLNFFEHFPG